MDKGSASSTAPARRIWRLVVICVSLLSILGWAKGQVTCPVGVTARNVSSTAEALELSDALNCSGRGQFEVDWSGNVLLPRTITISNGSSVKVTGLGPEAVIDGGGAVRLFEVDEGSTLEINRVSLVGGRSAGEIPGEGGGAVQLLSLSRLAAVNCSFVGNTAHRDPFSSDDDGGGGFIC